MRQYFRLGSGVWQPAVSFEKPYGKFWFRRSAGYEVPSVDYPRLHGEWPYFIEVEDADREGSSHARDLITAMYLVSDAAIDIGPTVYLGASATGGPVVAGVADSFGPWGHYHEQLTEQTVIDAVALQPRISDLSYPEKFNRLSTALRHYVSALNMVPSDIAQIVFMTVLEALFTQAVNELSFRLALSVAWFLGNDTQERRKVFGVAKELYTIRSKSVHGARVEDSEESSAIVLAEHHVPRSEELARRCLKKIFDAGVDDIFSRAKSIDDFFVPILVGATFEEAVVLYRGR